ncbi:MAG: hypothetical protein ACREHG_04250 [Candidatus Saccharimonadales bacterium]
MADDNEGRKVDTPKSKKHRQQIIVVSSIIGLLLMYLLLRKKSVGAQTATATQSAVMAQYQAQTQSQLATMANQLQTMHYQTVDATGTVGSGAGGIATVITDMTMLRSYANPPQAHITSTGTTIPQTEPFQGSGYGLPKGSQTVQGSTGKTFEGVPNWAAAQGIMASGGQIEYQPVPGKFYLGGANLDPGTPQFVAL